MGFFGNLGAAASGLGMAGSFIPGGQGLAALGAIAQKIDPEDMSGQIANPIFHKNGPRELYERFGPLWGIPPLEHHLDAEFAPIATGSKALRAHFEKNGGRIGRAGKFYRVKQPSFGGLSFGNLPKTVWVWRQIEFHLTIKTWWSREIIDAQDFVDELADIKAAVQAHGTSEPVFWYLDRRSFESWDAANVVDSDGRRFHADEDKSPFKASTSKGRKKVWAKEQAHANEQHEAAREQWFTWRAQKAIEAEKAAQLAVIQAQFSAAFDAALSAGPIGGGVSIPLPVSSSPGPVPAPAILPPLAPAALVAAPLAASAAPVKRPNPIAQLLAALLAPFQRISA